MFYKKYIFIYNTNVLNICTRRFDMENVEKKVVDIIAKGLHKKPEEVKLTSRLVEDLGADSLDFFELLMGFEDTFNVTVSDEDAAKFKTVGDIVNYLSVTKE